MTDTRREAHAAIQSRAASLRSRALLLFKRGGRLSADQVAVLMEEDKLSIRPRISELRQCGRIKDTGSRTTNSSGKRAVVWELYHD